MLAGLTFDCICYLNMYTVLQVGFKYTSYRVVEGIDYFMFEVEVTNNGTSTIPIDFLVTDTEGEALSEFS